MKNKYLKMLLKGNLKIVITLLVILLSNMYVKAQSYTVIGCVSDDTGYLYTGPSGVNSPRPGGYGPAYETTPVVTTGQIGTGIYCSPTNLGICVIRAKSRCTECTGPYDYDPSKQTTNNYYEQAGQLIGYMACPIDDYAGFIVIAIATVGFVSLRRNFHLS